MDREEAVKIFDLVVHEGKLPPTLDKLVPLSFIGSAAVSFYKAKVKLMDQLGMTEEQRKETLSDGQDAGKMLLTIEGRIGELLPSPVDAIKGEGKSLGIGGGPGKTKVLPDGIDSSRAHTARAIKAHPAAVAAVIAEAEANEDIPTKTAVLNRIRADKAEAANRAYKEGRPEDKAAAQAVMAKGAAATYLSKLREVVIVLPVSVPKDGWTDESFAEARAMVEIIKSRLEVWNE
jgi:hypothetical protein